MVKQQTVASACFVFAGRHPHILSFMVECVDKRTTEEKQKMFTFSLNWPKKVKLSIYRLLFFMKRECLLALNKYIINTS